MTHLQELAQNIAAALGPEWTRSPDFDNDSQDWRAALNGPERARLFLSNTWGRQGTLYISGGFPVKGRPQSQIKINLSLTKSPEQMAKDISRRLLPAYKSELVKALERERQTNEYKTAKEQTAREVAELVGDNTGGGPEQFTFYFDGNYIEVRSSDDIKATLYLTLAQLHAVVATLRGRARSAQRLTGLEQ